VSRSNGFASFAQQHDFISYVDYVIYPSYELHKEMGLLQYTMAGEKLETRMPFRNFLSGRLLWDEAMASACHAWTTSHPGGLMVGLVGADHVKFRNGIPARYARMATTESCTSVLLNPTLIDTRSPGTVGDIKGADSPLYPDKITLQLRYLKVGVDPSNAKERSLPSSTGGVLPLADYIVIS
jgi:hypothetical protein